jgi:uncharacterized protein (DUF983 family)
MSEKSSASAEFKQGRPRAVGRAMLNGFFNRCPACGEPGLFVEFLKTEQQCTACGTEFHHHRADDLPAYLVVLVLGHIMVGLVMLLQEATSLGIWQQLSIIAPISILFAILLLRPTKGAVVGLQWALYMHGFGGDNAKATVGTGKQDAELNG